MKKNLFFYLALALMSSSCVTKKAFNEMEGQYKSCAEKSEQAAKINSQKIADLENENKSLKSQVDGLVQDTTAQNLRMHQFELANKSLKQSNADLNEKLKNSNRDAEVKSLLADLQKIQDRLQDREDSILAVQRTVDAREKKVAELKKVIEEQNKSMESLKKRVAEALKGFEGRGLEVSYKDGKVYVSMDEKLLFQSGKWELSQNADSAISKLSTFLMDNRDVKVMVEGHTDSLAYRGNGYIIDNWDLSAKRSTAIVRQILKNKFIDPARVTAAARAEFVPIDTNTTREGRQRNRRTEIILTPNVEDVLNVFGETGK